MESGFCDCRKAGFVTVERACDLRKAGFVTVGAGFVTVESGLCDCWKVGFVTQVESWLCDSAGKGETAVKLHPECPFGTKSLHAEHHVLLKPLSTRLEVKATVWGFTSPRTVPAGKHDRGPQA